MTCNNLLFKRVEVSIPPGHHRLESTYSLWYSRKPQKGAHHQFDQILRTVATFSSAEQFWNLYSHMVRYSWSMCSVCFFQV